MGDGLDGGGLVDSGVPWTTGWGVGPGVGFGFGFGFGFGVGGGVAAAPLTVIRMPFGESISSWQSFLSNVVTVQSERPLTVPVTVIRRTSCSPLS
ncbi:MAG: hypothetical protein M3R57_01010, partial [Chloroflexota bacterium]|nr:hypothetical protein [Chloroflexota bacterium]